MTTLIRSEIGGCRFCGLLVPDTEKFKGIPNTGCTHMHSQGGWWLRIDHRWKEPDRVGELACPPCLESYGNLLKDLLEE